MVRKLRILGAIAVFAVVTGGCGTGSSAAGDGSPAVVAAFYPLAFAAEGVGGDLVEVEDLTAPGVEPHDLELSADQVRSLSEADLIVFLGKGFQPAVEDAVAGLDDSRTLDVLEGDLLQSVADEEPNGDAQVDPHVWLDPSLMTTIVDEVADRLGDIDPGHRRIYEGNAEELNARLVALDRDFSEALTSCVTRDIVTSHDAFGYLAARYDLNQVSVSGIDPETEPSPTRLAEVARFVQEHDVSTIFFEELVSPDVAQTIAAETGAQTAMLSPLESKPESGEYVDAMEANLVALTEALDCG
jgi:zinc transport system substrate-binding protein